MPYLPVRDYEGLYEVSDKGAVRSLDRKVLGADGVLYPFIGKTLASYTHKDLRYPLLNLYKNNKGRLCYVHRLVAQAHVTNPKDLPEVNHLNGNRADNRSENLEWVTGQQNKQHAVDYGLRTYPPPRLNTDQLLDCLSQVIAGESYAAIAQGGPYLVPALSTKVRKLAREIGWEDLLNTSLKQQAVQRARINGNPHLR